MKHLITLLALMSCAGMEFCANALEVNTKMGKPTKEELTMTTYAPDSEAEAVVLYSYRYTTYDLNSEGFVIVNTIKKRIKILKEDGKSYGDIDIDVYDEENSSSKDVLSGLKAVTYNDENGSVTKTKLNSDLKSEQRLDRYYKRIKLSMPNVKVGSVIELEYNLRSDAITYIDPWYAQEEIPVFYTYYEVKVPDWFRFSSSLTGGQNIQSNRKDENFTALLYGESISTSAAVEVYEGHELPRLKDDDFVFCLNDFCAKVTKDITNYTIPGHVYKSFNQDWSEELGNLMKSDYFGDLCNRNNPFKEEVKAIQWPEDFTLVQKIDSLRHLLWSSYSWDETYSLYARNVRNLNKEKSGTSATLNFALLNMLNDANIETYPVVMNNRKTGRLPMRPSQKYLKAMVLATFNPEDSTYIYFDAASKDYPVGVIPSRFLVPTAFLLKPATERYFTKDLTAVCRGSENYNLNLTLAADGSLTGTGSIAHRGLSAVNFRKSYKAASDESDFVQKLSAQRDFEMSDYIVANANTTNESVSESFSLQKQLDADGERIYIAPFLGLSLSSPFKAETRDLPVEYPYNYILKYAVNIQLPEGYVVEELPAKLSMKMPDGKLVARINFAQAGNRVNATVNINRSTLFYGVKDYELLRSIYTEIEKSANGRIVLKKAQ